MPMAGVPVKSADGYLQDLIRAGQTVVICDQVQDPKEAKGIVERAVTRIVTAGTVLEDTLLERDAHNYLAAVAMPEKVEPDALCGLAWVDLSTARFEGTSCRVAELADEWSRIQPVEVIVSEAGRDAAQALFDELREEERTTLTARPDVDFDAATAERRLRDHFAIDDLATFGIDGRDPLVAAGGAILAYLLETQRGLVGHVCRLRKKSRKGVMTLDRPARHALELLETARDRRRDGSLLGCVDRTETSAGSRLLRDWIVEPLTGVEEILARQAAVAELADGEGMRDFVRSQLRGVFDLERIAARLTTPSRRASARCSASSSTAWSRRRTWWHSSGRPSRIIRRSP
jgi:DNA mismatch repair protein MutS